MDGGELGKFTGGQAKEAFHLAVDIGAVWGWRSLLAGEQLGDVGLGDLGGGGEPALLEAELFEAVSNNESEIHGRLTLPLAIKHSLDKSVKFTDTG